MLKGRLQVVKIDTDKYGNIAGRYQISGLPTLILFKNGKPVDRVDGVVSAPELLRRLDKHL